MQKINEISADPLQEQTVPLPDGSSFTFTIRFLPMQYGWFIESLTYEDFKLEGFRISNSPNILRQFKNKLPFGLACISDAKREPSLLEDFSSESSILYLLTAGEVVEYEEFLSGK